MLAPSRQALLNLTAAASEPCISMYMPAIPPSQDVQQNPIRFRNLIRTAQRALTELGLAPRPREELLEPVQRLFEQRRWTDFPPGIGLFRAPDLLERLDLPYACDELVVVGKRFHIKPLLPHLSGQPDFRVLALSKNRVTLYEGNRHGLTEVAVDGMPISLAEALKYDDPEKQLQFHSGATGGSDARDVVFHGQGSGKDDDKKQLLGFLQRINRAVVKHLAPGTQPLVLAGVGYLVSLYREVNAYPGLHAEHIPGSPEHLEPGELFDRSLQLIKPLLQAGVEQDVARYRRLAGSNLASGHVVDIMQAADLGRVDTLFVALGRQQWGTFDALTRACTLHDGHHPGDEDLLNIAALDALKHGGRVYSLDPEDMPVPRNSAAAIYRF